MKSRMSIWTLAMAISVLQINGTVFAQNQPADGNQKFPANFRPAISELPKGGAPPSATGTAGTRQQIELPGTSNQTPNNNRLPNTLSNERVAVPRSTFPTRPANSAARSDANPSNTGAQQNAPAASAVQSGVPGPRPDNPTEINQTFTSNDQLRRPTEVTRVTRNFDTLPNTAGQIWREYDISPYTSKVKGVENPQQAILDWILSETGTEMWFNEPLGILNANRNQLFVYHTPEIHSAIKPIIDRFVKTGGQLQSLDVNLVTVPNPNWRADAYTMLQPIEVQSPGVEAWMISKENAAQLMSQLSRRPNFRRHSGGRLSASDGQKITLTKREPVQFVRSLRWVSDQIPNYQPLMTQVDEGYTLEFSSLSSLDNRTIEAVIRCDVDQVEKLSTVKVPVPYQVGQRAEKMNLQIPQIVSWRLKERFRWPADQVLLLSCGVVATPDPQTGTEMSRSPFRGLSQALSPNRSRADALVFIEYRGPSVEAELPAVLARGRLRPINQK